MRGQKGELDRSVSYMHENLRKIHVFKDLVMSKRLRAPFFWSRSIMNILHVLIKSYI